MIYLPFLILSLILFYIFVKSRNFNRSILSYKPKMVAISDELIVLGLYILDKFKINITGRYANYIKSLMIELYDRQNLLKYTKVYFAYKLVLILLSFWVASLIISFYGLIDEEIVLFSLILIGVAFVLPDSNLKKIVENRKFELKMEFPIFLNKLILLLNAGMNIKNAIERIVCENNKKSSFYIELEYTVKQINSGISEFYAYEEFAQKCKLPEISKFVSLIILNIKRGGADIIDSLKYQSKDCWEMRKHTARRLGEKASTKLILPMALMFLSVILIVIAPAIMLLKQ